ncbi:flagellar protein [Rhizobium sp. KVB221]|uniref:Flagellar protein n=1 Tax=Rhizobium setariae TaxID=2801340 RepID=A0A937CN27_9HYPH|nr:flagellar protein [Rhizobium setariae]MBL0370673.1 flagellar protein [Rhizobium setariae]
MTDFDADEPVAAPKKQKGGSWLTSDRFLGWSGAALALTAAFFPWYVFFNEDKFGIDFAKAILSRDLPERAGRPIVTPSPSGISDNDDLAALPRPEEQIFTGTIKDDASMPDGGNADAVNQPFPTEAVDFHLLHIAQGKAMIEDKNGIYIVAVGSLLPDLSKVSEIAEQQGEWVLVTDKGDIYDATGKRQR